MKSKCRTHQTGSCSHADSAGQTHHLETLPDNMGPSAVALWLGSWLGAGGRGQDELCISPIPGTCALRQAESPHMPSLLIGLWASIQGSPTPCGFSLLFRLPR